MGVRPDAGHRPSDARQERPPQGDVPDQGRRLQFLRRRARRNRTSPFHRPRAAATSGDGAGSHNWLSSAEPIRAAPLIESSVVAYVKRQALGWKKKAFTTKDGRESGGGERDENTFHRLLKNPLYIGKVVHNDDVFDGEHEAIIEGETFERVPQLLAAKACGRGPRRGRNPEYLLTSLLFCPKCGKALTTSSGRGSNGSRKDHRYYACRNRQAHGVGKCAGVYVPAADIEPAVIGRVREICADPEVRTEVGRRLDAGKATIADDLTEKRAVLEERIEKLTAEGKALVASIKQMGGKGGTPLPARLGEIEAELDGLRAQANELDDRMRGLIEAVGRVSTAVGLLESFDELWAALAPEERVDLVRLLVARIDVDLDAGKLELHLHDLAAPFPPLPPPEGDDPDGDEAPEKAAS